MPWTPARTPEAATAGWPSGCSAVHCRSGSATKDVESRRSTRRGCSTRASPPKRRGAGRGWGCTSRGRRCSGPAATCASWSRARRGDCRGRSPNSRSRWRRDDGAARTPPAPHRERRWRSGGGDARGAVRRPLHWHGRSDRDRDRRGQPELPRQDHRGPGRHAVHRRRGKAAVRSRADCRPAAAQGGGCRRCAGARGIVRGSRRDLAGRSGSPRGWRPGGSGGGRTLPRACSCRTGQDQRGGLHPGCRRTGNHEDGALRAWRQRGPHQGLRHPLEEEGTVTGAALLALALSVDPSLMRLGSDARAAVRVQADAKPATAASVGTIEGLHRARDGIWEAQYVPPDDAIPQVAILTAAAGGEVAWLAIPLWAEGDAVVKTRPRGRISVDIGSQTFGPVVADARGDADVPVVVPPGVYEAHHGKRVISLHAPRSRSIHVAFGYATLPADR